MGTKKTAIVVVAILALAVPAFAGIRLTTGHYTASPGGGFDVSTGGSVLENWTDGHEHVWHDSPPPSGNGYYQYNGPPVQTVNFTGGQGSGNYTSSGGSGTYTRG